MQPGPSIEIIKQTRESLRPNVIETPVIDGRELLPYLPKSVGSLGLKAELFQRSGSFKFRGALNVISSLSEDERRRGITAFSGGNHAIAVSYVAQALGISAKVVMPSVANPLRVKRCRDLGAEVFLVEKRSEVPALAHSFVANENRTLVPPFDHEKTIEATASLGIEFLEQNPGMDVVLMAIGGGGLAAGVGAAIKQLSKHCKVIGVQPSSADAMARSLQSGKREPNDRANTVADSLCPPEIGELTFKLCQHYLDDIVIVEEEAIRHSMGLLFDRFKIVAEGAAAVPLAALLSDRVELASGSNVGIILGGSSIDFDTFRSHSQR